jgi:hypothetical protein
MTMNTLIQDFSISKLVLLCVTVYAIFVLTSFKIWFKHYLTKKAELFATKEDLANLLTQTQKITEVTENIKSGILYRSWHNQQYWSIKEKHYTEILKHLTICKSTIIDRLEFYQTPCSEYDDSCSNTELFINLSQKAQVSFLVLRDLIGPASIFLSDTTIETLTVLNKEHAGIANYGAVCMKDYLESTYKEVDKAFCSVLYEARNQLNNETII